MAFDTQALAEAAKRDPEFRRETRYLDGHVKIDMAGQILLMHFSDGALTGISADARPDKDCKIFIRGTREHWDNLLQHRPKPFYQCLQSTAVKHQLEMSATNATFAYLPALNRLTQLMRDQHGKGA